MLDTREEFAALPTAEREERYCLYAAAFYLNERAREEKEDKKVREAEGSKLAEHEEYCLANMAWIAEFGHISPERREVLDAEVRSSLQELLKTKAPKVLMRAAQ